jgi:signal transduction histidine kinase
LLNPLGSGVAPGVTTKPAGPVGRGLGLSLVRRAAKALGGTVTARNDGGAVFTVTLPHAEHPALTP